MVARQFAPGRAVAAAILATLLISIVPTPVAQAQQVRDISVEQGEARILQANFHQGRVHTPFVDDGTAAITLQVPVYNTGSAISNIPVYYFFYNSPAEDSAGYNTVSRSGCIKVSVPAPEAGATRGMTLANITIDTRDLPGDRGYNVSVHAFTVKPGAVTNDCTGTDLNRPFVANSGNGCLPVNCDSDINNNNTLNAYFVKGGYLSLEMREILWCMGEPTTGTPCDSSMLEGDSPVNITTQDGSRDTYFEAVVANVGSWANMTDYGGKCNCTGDGFRYDFNLTINGAHINTTWPSARVNTSDFQVEEERPVHRARSDAWDIVNTSGRYNVTVKLDPLGHLRRPAADTTVDVMHYDADVLYRDYTANFTASDLRTDPANPYPYDGPFIIAGNVTFRNDGPAGALVVNNVPYDANSPYAVNYTIFINNESGFSTGVHLYTPQEPGSSLVVPFAFDLSSTSTSPVYIPPGKHTIHARIDIENHTLESNETNNNISIDVYVRDLTVPTFNNTPEVKAGVSGAINTADKFEFYPHEPFNLFANVSDDDAGLTVVANFSLASNSSVYRVYPMERQTDSYSLQLTDFDFHDFANASVNGSENWTITVRANDSSDNNASSVAAQALRLKPWPIHSVDAETIIELPQEFPNETVIPWAGDSVAFWKIRVLPNWTGFMGNPQVNQTTGANPCPCQQNYTANLAYNVTTATGKTFDQDGSYWRNETPWEPSGTCRRPAANSVDPGSVLPTDPCDPNLNNTFTASFSKTQEGAGPGRWNYSIRISDVAGHARVINGTILVEDSAPEFQTLNLSTDRLAPGGNFTVNMNVTDDDNTITAAHVHFTRTNPPDGAVVNLTLTEFEEEADEPGKKYFNYTQTFTVGRNEVFGLGGTFNVTFAASDLTGNWNMSQIGNFTVVDEDAPVLASYGVLPPVAQIGDEVSFWAKVSDSTNVTVKLEIFTTTTSSELLLDAIMLNESPDGNFTGTVNFTAEGVHGWRLTPVDSVNRAGALGEGTLTIRDNLGPRFDIRSPGTVIDGVHYGSGRARIDVVVFDVEGVANSSIDMRVAGLPVDYTIAPAPGNLNGFLVSYDIPANKKFSHEDVVEVSLSAEDLSDEQLRSELNFTFVVDDVAPVARISTIAPSYRDQPAHMLNVSLNSRFTLVAEDNDGMPTGVESIRYRIRGGGSSAETVYNGPFKINDAPGVYTGPRVYQIEFWAEDAVGNFNPVFNVTSVYVDDTPPALFQFFPQGRVINATFVDDRVGVNRSVVWYRVNGEPYVPLPLVEENGAWSLTLPEGVKGDQVAYYLQAWDRLDNTETFGNATAPYASFNVDNHEPKIRITAPVDGSRIFRSVDLTWDASDEDGDALVFTIYYKAPGRTNFVELAKLENSAARRYTIDSARFPDGQYTFRVAAGDGGFVKLAETTVTILNRASAVGVVNVVGGGVPGETMLITAEITKAEAIVEARLFLNGKLVDSYPMNDEGKDGDEVANDGFYSIRVPIQSAGDYSVEIFTQYREDGELKESSLSNAATFNAKLTPGYLLSHYGAVIAVIGLLAAVGIGVAVFVVMRRR